MKPKGPISVLSKNFQKGFLLVAASVVFGLFQNCSSGKFNGGMIDPTLGGTSLSSNAPSCSYVTPNIQFAKPSSLLVGGIVTGYPASSVIEGPCSPLTVACLSNKNWSGPVPLYTSCKQLCKNPSDATKTVDPGTHFVWYRKSSAATAAACDLERVDSVCDADPTLPGKFSPAVPTAPFTQCIASGITCSYTQALGMAPATGNTLGSTITGYTASSSAGALCSTLKITSTCMAGNTGGYWDYSGNIYAACTQQCLTPGTNVPAAVGTLFPTFYTKNFGTTAECLSAKVDAVCTESTGLFEPAALVAGTRYSSCTEINPPTVLFTSSSTTINAGNSVQLNWDVKGASSILLSDGVTTQPISTALGSLVVTPSVTTTYKLEANYSIGAFPAAVTIKMITITVNPPPAPTLLSCQNPFGGTGNYTGTIVTGFLSATANGPTSLCTPVSLTCNTTTGNWNGAIPIVANCTQYCVAGSVQRAGGEFYPTFYTKEFGTTAECSASTVTNSVVCDTKTGVFLYSSNGTAFDPASVFATCTPIDPPKIVSFSSSKDSVRSGSSFTLSWEVHGYSKIELMALAQDGTLLNTWDVTGSTDSSILSGFNGTKTLSITQKTTYTLKATYSVGTFPSVTTTSNPSVTVSIK